jgi:hypothetical protein
MELKKMIERVRDAAHAERATGGATETQAAALELAADIEKLMEAHSLGAEQLAQKIGNLLDNERLPRKTFDVAVKRMANYIATDRFAQRLADADLARALKYAEGLGGERHKIFNQACDYIAEQLERGARS